MVESLAASALRARRGATPAPIPSSSASTGRLEADAALTALFFHVDLRTGETRTPNRSDFITKCAAVDPALPGTAHPLWSAFLDTVTNDNAELIAFLQRFIGYGLTAITREHVLAFLYGTGGNGKGVFIKTVSKIMGDYALAAAMEMFLASRHERHPTEIARLYGARLVTVQETQKGRHWDEAKIKNLTSADKQSGRFMGKDFFDFDPTHKLMFSGNHKPSLKSCDEAMRRRFLLVPFTTNIPQTDRDPLLATKLEAEWPAILRWMIDGCLYWQRFGLMVPKVVSDATDKYLEEQNTLKQWADEWLRLDPRAFVKTMEIFAHWKSWNEARNQHAGTSTAFSSDLSDLGYEGPVHTKNGNGFNGISLIKPAEPEEPELEIR